MQIKVNILFKCLFLSTLILLSVQANNVLYAEEPEKSIFNLYRNAALMTGLIPIPPEFKTVPGSEIVIQDMPSVRDQGAMPACYAFAIATLFDKAYCDEKKISPCSQAATSVKASPLDITRFNKHVASNKDYRDRFAYEGLTLDGGGVTFNLANTVRSGSVAKDSCFPANNLIANINNPVEALKVEQAYWRRIEDAYKTYQTKSKTCHPCGLEYAIAEGKTLKATFKLTTTDNEILEAFKSSSYELFLDKLFIPDSCWDFENTLGLSSKWTQKVYPNKDTTGNYSSVMNQVKTALFKKSPLGIVFCTQTPLTAKSLKECGSTHQDHTIVIKGYRKACNSKNVCRESLQVQGSWGQSWQDNNNDGWVDAKELLDRTFYEEEQMTWLEKNVD